MPYRKIYQQHYGEIPTDELGRSYHIHHKDGNHFNNHHSNLQAVSLQEHYEIHLREGNLWAALRLAQRLGMSQEQISDLSRQTQLKRISEGTHPFQVPGICSKGGKKGIRHVKENGWSKDAIEKRTKTMRNKGHYNNFKMKEANSKESIQKRVETRKKKGYDQTASIKAKIILSLRKLCSIYKEPFSYELLEKGRKTKTCRVKPENVKKYLSAKELRGLWPSLEEHLLPLR